MTQTQNKWIDHYLKMVKGQLPHQKYYVVPDPPQKGQMAVTQAEMVVKKGEGDDFKVIAPTQMFVAQAEMAVKRTMDTPALDVKQKGGAVTQSKMFVKRRKMDTLASSEKSKG